MHNNLWKKFKILIHKLFHHILDEINSGVIEIQLSNGTFSFKRNAQILKSNFSFNVRDAINQTSTRFCHA
jgi:hypothetical protein